MEFYNEEETEKIINGSLIKRKTTLRVNTLKTSVEAVAKVFDDNEIVYKHSPFSHTALIIENDNDKIRALELYGNGEIYLQSLSSQLPALILNPNQSCDVLDMCAAPGGKTTQLAMLSNNKCNITACEMNRNRAERLKFNLQKQGVTNANVMVIDARNLESFFSFDKILLDAPCSGSGTFNLNNPKSYSGFSAALIDKCVTSQAKLLDKALSVLKVGGELVYSTCSVLPIENEKQLLKAMKKHNCELLEIDNSIKNHLPLLPCSLENALCITPTDEYEGFFVAKIRKIG